MDELERRVVEALDLGAADAPEVAGLADAARGRARRRARRTTAAVVVGVALAVVAVPTALALGRGDSQPGPVDRPPTAEDLGWRLETYHDLEVRVPPTWRTGTLSVWCVDDTRGAFGGGLVERPGQATMAIGCVGPVLGYGVRFVAAAELESEGRLVQAPAAVESALVETPVPGGAWYGHRTDATGKLALQVVAPDRDTAERVLDSVRTVDGEDGNGCALEQDAPGRAVETGTVAICTYDTSSRLLRSELLTGADAATASAALGAAPPAAHSGATVCRLPLALPQVFVVLREPGRSSQARLGSACAADNALAVDGEARRLTEDVVYWALTPGFTGMLGDGVPEPDRLRGAP